MREKTGNNTIYYSSDFIAFAAIYSSSKVIF